MIWVIGYVLGSIATFVIAFRRILWRDRDYYGRLEGEHYVMAALLAVCAGWFWPLVAVGAPFIAWVKRDLEENHPEEVAARQRDREFEIREREREIERIEIELGIRGMRR